MAELNATVITRVLDSLIGNTFAVGRTEIDSIRNDNLKTLIEVTNWCIDSVRDSYELNSNEIEFSVRSNGKIAERALREWRNWINEVLND